MISAIEKHRPIAPSLTPLRRPVLAVISILLTSALYCTSASGPTVAGIQLNNTIPPIDTRTICAQLPG